MLNPRPSRKTSISWKTIVKNRILKKASLFFWELNKVITIPDTANKKRNVGVKPIYRSPKAGNEYANNRVIIRPNT
jgi:hypothetical protein